MKCQYEGCNNTVIYKIIHEDKSESYSCKNHRSNLENSYRDEYEPVNNKVFQPSKDWINAIKEPDILKEIEISDGKLVDTGFFMAGNWYMDNYHYIMGDIKYWKYINQQFYKIKGKERIVMKFFDVEIKCKECNSTDVHICKQLDYTIDDEIDYTSDIVLVCQECENKEVVMLKYQIVY